MKKIKKFIFPGIGLLVSIWFSAVFCFWAVLGFFATEIFIKKYIYTGKIGLLKFNLRNWEVQLHHWFWPGLVVVGAYFFGFTSALSLPVLGVASGIMFQDLYRDKKWHKVIYKKTR